MSDFVFTAAKGRGAHYADAMTSGFGDALMMAVPLQAAGLASDADLRGADSLSAVLAGSSNEQTDLGRVVLSGVTVSVDGDTTVVSCDPIIWDAATGPALGAVLICYFPESTAVDLDVVPVTKHDFAVTPSGGDITAVPAATGVYRAA